MYCLNPAGLVRSLRNISLLCVTVVALLGLQCPAFAQGGSFYTPREVRIDQRMESQLPLDAPFEDENGRVVTLGMYFGKKPVLLNMIFYRCAGVCTLELEGLCKAIPKMDLRPGRDYEVLTVSIDPKEGPALAQGKRQSYMQLPGMKGAESGWHFLTGPEGSITRLAQATGFHYKYNPKNNTYAHSAALMIATPEGKLSRYFFGANYNPRDLALAVVEASNGKIGTPVQDVILLLCHFDPLTGRYALAITRLVQAFGILTVIILGGSVSVMSIRGNNSRKKEAAGRAEADS